MDGVTGELLEYRHLIKRPEHKDNRGYSFGSETGRLAQGMLGQNNGTDSLFFINKSKVPSDRWKDIAYGKNVCNVCPQTN